MESKENETCIHGGHSEKPKLERRTSYLKTIKKEACDIDKLYTAVNGGVTHLCIHACDSSKSEKNDYDVWIMCELLDKAKNLVELEISLDNAATTDEGCKSIGVCLKNHENLTSFRLTYHGNNNISDLGVEHIINGLNSIKQLENLALCFCDAGSHVTDQSARLISCLIKEQPYLKYINLNFGDGANRITDIGISYLAEALSKLIEIEKLELLFYHGENEITDKGLENLSNTLQNLKKLQYLSLDFFEGKNKIHDAGFKHLSTAITSLEKLTKIELHLRGGGKVSDSMKKALRIELMKKNPDCALEIE